jgi:hypothetical protein
MLTQFLNKHSMRWQSHELSSWGNYFQAKSSRKSSYTQEAIMPSPFRLRVVGTGSVATAAEAADNLGHDWPFQRIHDGAVDA